MIMERREVLIHKINRKEKEFEKDGKSWTSVTVGILVNPEKGVWLNGFQDDQTKDWKKGDAVTVDVEVKKSNGNTYYNFKTVDKKELQLDRIEEKLDKVLDYVATEGTPFEQ